MQGYAAQVYGTGTVDQGAAPVFRPGTGRLQRYALSAARTLSDVNGTDLSLIPTAS